ncbi:DTW domain-containing protein [Marinibactrum halimedae]|uniref:tRNA-uridine aminocarboxypropyltransferase n=1 Tax=Marinibactrum halimedae TaxID=1444977 RepID=A0AA37T3R3_9GAMM|nr:DTW domain-containing protein [Marinibactrum halimedae]MCD9457876.1 DTW domain-containing protein [Marinibactrum halimedae]GLS26303.1 DTW domain-containing protein [Marinibactrum halimedae]
MYPLFFRSLIFSHEQAVAQEVSIDKKNDVRSQYCQRCGLSVQKCFCHALPYLSESPQFHLVVHPREVSKRTNTGSLACACMAMCGFEIWSRQHASAVDCNRDIVVFPKALANEQALYRDLKELIAPQPQPPQSHDQSIPISPRFILLDATWQQARKMYRQSPWLHTLLHTELPLFDCPSSDCPSDSRYMLRKRQSEGHFSTLEVIAWIVNATGNTRDAEALQDVLAHFQSYFHS